MIWSCFYQQRLISWSWKGTKGGGGGSWASTVLLFNPLWQERTTSPADIYNLCYARYATAGRAVNAWHSIHLHAWFIFFSVIAENTGNRSINNRQIIFKIFDIACHCILAHMIVLYIHCTVRYVFICYGYINTHGKFHSIRKRGRCVIYFCFTPIRLEVNRKPK